VEIAAPSEILRGACGIHAWRFHPEMAKRRDADLREGVP
jgi:hypothetical protein